MTLNFEITGPGFNIPKDVRDVLASMGTKQFVVSMTPVYGQRSSRQNAYFHLLIDRIGTASGCDKNDLKTLVKSKAMELGYPPQTDPYGRLVLDEKGKATPLPTHLANSKDMQILIEAAYYVASEAGIELDPLADRKQEEKTASC